MFRMQSSVWNYVVELLSASVVQLGASRPEEAARRIQSFHEASLKVCDLKCFKPEVELFQMKDYIINLNFKGCARWRRWCCSLF